MKLEINIRRKYGKLTEMWRLNNTFKKPTNQSKKVPPQGQSENTWTPKNENTSSKNLWNTGKAVFKNKFLQL